MQVLLTDTVGFIQKLPTQLVAAFRATLEEITEASLLLHVVDVSHPNAAAQTQAVMQVHLSPPGMLAAYTHHLPAACHSLWQASPVFMHDLSHCVLGLRGIVRLVFSQEGRQIMQTDCRVLRSLRAE